MAFVPLPEVPSGACLPAVKSPVSCRARSHAASPSDIAAARTSAAPRAVTRAAIYFDVLDVEPVVEPVVPPIVPLLPVEPVPVELVLPLVPVAPVVPPIE